MCWRVQTRKNARSKSWNAAHEMNRKVLSKKSRIGSDAGYRFTTNTILDAAEACPCRLLYQDLSTTNIEIYQKYNKKEAGWTSTTSIVKVNERDFNGSLKSQSCTYVEELRQSSHTRYQNQSSLLFLSWWRLMFVFIDYELESHLPRKRNFKFYP